MPHFAEMPRFALVETWEWTRSSLRAVWACFGY